MILYLEYVIFDNLIISYLVIKLSESILHIKIKKLNFILACCIFVVFSIFLPLLKINVIAENVLKMLLSFLICLVVIDNPKLKTKFLPFYFCFITLNLIVYAMFSIIVKIFNCEVSLANYTLNFPIAVVFLALFLYFKILIKFFAKLKKSYDVENCIYDVHIEYLGKKIKLNAFLDTGNALYDNVENLPIAVVPLNVAEKLLSKEELMCIMFKSKSSSIKNLHYINYSTASSKQCLMPVFKLDKMVIEKNQKKINVDCMLGVAFGKVTKGKEYEMLLGLKHIANLK